MEEDKDKKNEKRSRRNWSNLSPNIKITTWNTRSLTRERFEYCRNLGYDVLGLTELWRGQNKYQDVSVLWTCSATLRDKQDALKRSGSRSGHYDLSKNGEEGDVLRE